MKIKAVCCMGVLVAVALLSGNTLAGYLEPTSTPGQSTMHSLDEIYIILQDIDAILGAGVVSSYEAPVERSGQTNTYASYDDGYFKSGVVWPNPRFSKNGDETVTDNLTGLVWLKDAGRYPSRNWEQAISGCTSCNVGGYSDWRLPNIQELLSLVDYKYYEPCLSNGSGTGHFSSGDPFENVFFSYYWSSTTHPIFTSNAKILSLSFPHISLEGKTKSMPAWCVRGPE